MRKNGDASTGFPRTLGLSLSRWIFPFIGSSLFLLPLASAQQPANVITPASAKASEQSTATPYAAVEPSTPKPPKVSFQDDELTIIAENSRLSDVLTAIRGCTGADLDIPPTAYNDRVWVNLGPGPARKIIATLLDGTNVDYVIQSADADPDQIRSVMITLRTKPGATPEPVLAGEKSNVRIPKANQPAQDFQAIALQQPAEKTEAATTAATSPAAAPATTPAAAPDVLLASDAPGTDGSKAAPSSVDPMIQKLESMYEQRKQLQLQAATPKPPGAN
jgi:hypothetical protein